MKEKVKYSLITLAIMCGLVLFSALSLIAPEVVVFSFLAVVFFAFIYSIVSDYHKNK